ncbi:hypothetical protein QTP88_023319 [Uroleucon formosanum]
MYLAALSLSLSLSSDSPAFDKGPVNGFDDAEVKRNDGRRGHARISVKQRLRKTVTQEHQLSRRRDTAQTTTRLLIHGSLCVGRASGTRGFGNEQGSKRAASRASDKKKLSQVVSRHRRSNDIGCRHYVQRDMKKGTGGLKLKTGG